jgi:hypothetical protein
VAALEDGAPVTWTATVAVERAGARDVFHAVASQRIRIGYIVCAANSPLCGTEAELQSSPDGLFAPQVTCQRCAVIAAREHISISGTEPATTTRRTT